MPGLLAEDSRVRPLWLVGLLSLLTLGTYSIRRGWSGAVRAYRYFSLVTQVGRGYDVRTVAPLLPTLGIATASLLALAALAALLTGTGTRGILWAVALALMTITITAAQADVNRVWYAAIGRYAEDHVTSAEWGALVVGFIFLPLFVIGALSAR